MYTEDNLMFTFAFVHPSSKQTQIKKMLTAKKIRYTQKTQKSSPLLGMWTDSIYYMHIFTLCVCFQNVQEKPSLIKNYCCVKV